MSMTRRGFLKSLGAIGVTAAIAPKLIAAESVLQANETLEFQPIQLNDSDNTIPIGSIVYYKLRQFVQGSNGMFTYIIKGDHCWYECNGQRVLKVENPKLFNTIGNAYGKVRVASFALPDYRERNIATGRNVS